MICRRFRPEDKSAVIQMLRESMDGWHGAASQAYWEWKFEHNPHGPARIPRRGGRAVECGGLDVGEPMVPPRAPSFLGTRDHAGGFAEPSSAPPIVCG